jgi:hypothetical protein
VTNAETLAQIEYYANSNLIGSSSNAPYWFLWEGLVQQGPYVLAAKATDRQGGVTWSKPVNVAIGPTFWVWGPRVLPTGELLFHYNAFPLDGLIWLAYLDSPVTTNSTWLATLDGTPGIFVDESVRGSGVPARFYVIRY